MRAQEEEACGWRAARQSLPRGAGTHSFIHSFNECSVSTYCVPDLCYGPDTVLLSGSPQPHIRGLDTSSSDCRTVWQG